MNIIRHDNAADPAGFDLLLGFAERALITRDWSRLTVPAGLQLGRKIEFMRRAGHCILFVRWAGQGYVLKFFADFGDKRTGRRLEFLLKNVFTNPARKSFLGARLMQRAGVPVIEPVACLTTSSPFSRRGVFIYREAEAFREEVFKACMGGSTNPYWMRYWQFIQNTDFKPWKRVSRRFRKRRAQRKQ